MYIFKCKMCGGTIEFEPGSTIGMCDSCGTKQTLPKLDDDRRANLYDRANHFRRNNEFDKAAGLYEQILNEDNTDSEAYWSLVLCRYGIEYVEDPATRRRVPTVNRAQFTSIFDDDNYKSALQYADGSQRELYEKEANTINEIQKGILAISQKEEPFDVFICYKETDNNGRRTPDSVLANDLYHQLTQEGFKVFFARITLEDKLGTAYEPYIFAALNSAKVMVVLGTRPEYFNAVWVKNEWSRYLSLVKNSNGRKVLIPAYRDMDPYDLPEEFSHLQAQDMSKLGFMQDLIRGIKKISETDDSKATVKETVVINNYSNVAPLLKRAFMFLEDGEWDKADDLCEQVLNKDPENAQAYVGKLMAEMHAHKQEDLTNCAQPFDNNSNYQKAVRFGDDSLSSVLKGYNGYINDKLQAILNALKKGAYNKKSLSLDEKLEKAKLKIESLTTLRNKFDTMLNQISQLKQEEMEIDIQESNLTRQRSNTGLFSIKEKKRIDNELNRVSEEKKKLAILIRQNEEKLSGFYSKEELNKEIEKETLAMIELEKLIENNRNTNTITYSFQEAVNAYLCEPEMTRTINSLLYPTISQDSVAFGRIHEGYNSNKQPIEWQILTREKNRVLLICKYALDCREYCTTKDASVDNPVFYEPSWGNSTLRKWLNDTFLYKAFSENEINMIPSVTVNVDNNPVYKNYPEQKTRDKIFVLNITEAKNYFETDSARQCSGTSLCYEKGASRNQNGNCQWWLRTRGMNGGNITCVDANGSINNRGEMFYCKGITVRPAMWINLGD